MQNPTDVVVSQQVEIDYELLKTSLFTVAPADVLPKDLELGKLLVDVPQEWQGNSLVAYSIDPIEKFPLSSIRESKPYRGTAKWTMPVNIPPKSRMNVNIKINEYKLKCSFQALIKNKTTGQYRRVSGKWAGLLKYDSTATSVTQQPL